MTPDIVTEARQLLAEITPRPWQQAGRGVEGERRRVLLADCMRWDDAAFIAAAPRLVTGLVAEVERLRTALDAAQLRSIEARNPGIDMDEVRRLRDRAGYQIVPKAERPSVCPTCRSHNPRIAGHWNGYLTRPCPDPWHGGAE